MAAETPEKGRYRKIQVRTWVDERFRALTPIPPCAQGLWFFLLTGPFTSSVPGLFRAGKAAMAEELCWEQEAFDKAFQEVLAQGMAKADFKARLVWLPKALQYNKPESPNVVRSWRSELDLLPECALKDEAITTIRAELKSFGDAFARAFDEVFKPSSKPSGKPSAKPLPEPLAKALPNQEQEQEQEQEKEREPRALASEDAPDPTPAREPTPAGDTCRRLIKLGIPQVNPSHPALLDLLTDGATPEAIEQTAAELAQRGRAPGFKLVLATVRGRMEDVAAGVSSGRSIRAPPPRASISTPLPEPGSYGQSDIPDDWTPAQVAS